jgi:hypothetical protein
MIKKKADVVEIVIMAEDAFKALADLESLIVYLRCKDGSKEFQKSLQTAVECMQAFCVEHFEKELNEYEQAGHTADPEDHS